MVVSTRSTTEKSCGQNAIADPMIVELVVAEPVEASKHRNDHCGKNAYGSGFDKLNHRRISGTHLPIKHQASKYVSDTT